MIWWARHSRFRELRLFVLASLTRESKLSSFHSENLRFKPSEFCFDLKRFFCKRRAGMIMSNFKDTLCTSVAFALQILISLVASLTYSFPAEPESSMKRFFRQYTISSYTAFTIWCKSAEESEPQRGGSFRTKFLTIGLINLIVIGTAGKTVEHAWVLRTLFTQVWYSKTFLLNWWCALALMLFAASIGLKCSGNNVRIFKKYQAEKMALSFQANVVMFVRASLLRMAAHYCWK